MNKIILIEKYGNTSRFWPNFIKRIKIPDLTVEKLMEKYEGFEGEHIALYPIEENDSDTNEILNMFFEMPNLENYLMLYVISERNKTSKQIEQRAVKIGFDVGICEEQGTPYSSIFFEILFGGVNELIKFKENLNEHFLFNEEEIAQEYVQIHKKMDEEGKDVEHEVMKIYEIWKFETIG